MIPQWCEKYIDIPFVENGNSFAGCNCWGLFWLIYRVELEIELPLYNNEYSDSEDGEAIAAIIRRETAKWKPFDKDSKPDIFDAIVLRINGEPWHIGCVVDPDAGKMLHIEKNLFACIEPYNGLMWKKRKLGFYRYVG